VIGTLSLAPSSFSAVQGVVHSGTIATLTDTNTSDPASALAATISWGDGTAAAGGTVTGSAGSFTVSGSHTYTAPGSVTVSITVTNTTTGATANTSFGVNVGTQLAITGVPFSPTQSIAMTGLTVASFTDQIATDTTSSCTATISWGDNTTPSTGVISAQGSSFLVSGSHTYTAPGQLTVQVSVTDPATGAIANTSYQVTVAPQLTITPTPFSLTQNVNGPISAGNLTDAITTEPASAFSATINWGDGSTNSPLNFVPITPGAGTFYIEWVHKYAGLGPYNVSLVVNDSLTGASATTSYQVTVAPQLTITPTPFSLTQNVSGPISAGNLTDAITTEPASAFSATINWGDGSTNTPLNFVPITPGAGTFYIEWVHKYAGLGPYDVSLVVNDSLTGASANTAYQVTVAPQLVVTAPSPTPSVVINTPFTITVANVADAVTGDVASNLSATIMWGDGVTDTGINITGASGSFQVNGPAHMYTAFGGYNVTVTVTDPGTGATGSVSYKITVHA
jgi:hypothetical protein